MGKRTRRRTTWGVELDTALKRLGATLEAFAAHPALGVDDSTIYRWMTEETLPAYKQTAVRVALCDLGLPENVDFGKPTAYHDRPSFSDLPQMIGRSVARAVEMMLAKNELENSTAGRAKAAEILRRLARQFTLEGLEVSDLWLAIDMIERPDDADKKAESVEERVETTRTRTHGPHV